jgi:phenylalanyl-tRNA synthetase beta chain
MPAPPREARELLDDVGIEVKSVETSSLGTVFNVELLANRGDHYCYQGVAREVAGRTGGKLHFPKLRKLDVLQADETRVRIETPLCLVYTVTELFVEDRRSRLSQGRQDCLPSTVPAPLTAADAHPTRAPSITAWYLRRWPGSPRRKTPRA